MNCDSLLDTNKMKLMKECRIVRKQCERERKTYWVYLNVKSCLTKQIQIPRK